MIYRKKHRNELFIISTPKEGVVAIITKSQLEKIIEETLNK